MSLIFIIKISFTDDLNVYYVSFLRANLSGIDLQAIPPQKSHLLMIQIFTRYLFYKQIHQDLICMISLLSCSAFSRYTGQDTGLIWNLQVSSIVFFLPHQNPIYRWSQSILGIFLASKSIINRFAEFHPCHASLLWSTEPDTDMIQIL